MQRAQVGGDEWEGKGVFLAFWNFCVFVGYLEGGFLGL